MTTALKAPDNGSDPDVSMQWEESVNLTALRILGLTALLNSFLKKKGRESLAGSSPSMILETLLMTQVEKGLFARSLARLKEHLQMSDANLSQLLDVSQKTVQRLKQNEGERLSRTQSNQLYRAARMLALATQVFEGNDEAARRWLLEKQTKLGGQRPIDLLRTDIGTREVETLLWRMEYGVYA